MIKTDKTRILGGSKGSPYGMGGPVRGGRPPVTPRAGARISSEQEFKQAVVGKRTPRPSK